jgi:cytoskeletal protein CcmA (bactofilin family)
MRGLLRFFGLADAPEPVERPFAPPGGATTTTIGPGITLKGELQGEGTLAILGQFEGDIVLQGSLHVGPEARVDANISATAIVIAGAVRGNLSADTRVDILPTGSLTGTVKSGSFAAADGASVKGEIWVERAAPAPERPSA